MQEMRLQDLGKKAAGLVKGWCPGAVRPMETGDGFLVRLRLTGGRLDAARAGALADLSRRFGNGLLELSSRANLQIRGVAESSLAGLQGELDRLGLLDKDAAAEAVRNVVASPLAGLDPSARLDIQPLVTALEQRLMAETPLHALPAKFGFAVDDGGAFPLGSAIADVVVAANAAARFDIFLGGQFAGTVAPGRLVDLAAECAHAFLDLRKGERRMAPLIERIGMKALRRRIGLHPGRLIADTRAEASVVGYRAPGTLGLALPFGGLSAQQLAFAATRAEEIRLTPWRALFLIGAKTGAGLTAEMAAQGFITHPDDPLLGVAACPGSPACASAFASTRRDARRLAGLAAAIGSGVSLHVSGCAKGCARGRKTAATLTGTESGYALILDGKADGTSVAENLTLNAAETLLRGFFPSSSLPADS